jgi:integrase
VATSQPGEELRRNNAKTPWADFLLRGDLCKFSLLTRLQSVPIVASRRSSICIVARLSTHIFLILSGNGEDVKVVQELLRHSTSRMRLDTYAQALGPDKRAAQSKVAGMIRPKERVFSVYRDADGVSV